MKYICESTKTENGIREIPMNSEVMEAFKRIIKQLQQKQRKKKFVQLLIGIAILLLIRAVVTLITG